MTHPGLFSDLGKKANDLLTKDFPDRTKFDIKTKNPQLDASVTVNPDHSVYASVFPKFTVAKGVTVGAQIDSKRSFKGEVAVEDMVPGLKTTFTGHVDTESVTIDAEYKREYISATASVNLFSAQGNRVSTSLVCGYDGYFVGVQTDFVNDKWRNGKAILSYVHPSFIATGSLNMDTVTATNIAGLSYHQRLAFLPKATIAAGVITDTNKKSESPVITLAGSYDVDFATTYKAKINTEGKASVSFGHRLNQYARLVIGTTVNTNNFSASGNHSFGINLSLND